MKIKIYWFVSFLIILVAAVCSCGTEEPSSYDPVDCHGDIEICIDWTPSGVSCGDKLYCSNSGGCCSRDHPWSCGGRCWEYYPG